MLFSAFYDSIYKSLAFFVYKLSDRNFPYYYYKSLLFLQVLEIWFFEQPVLFSAFYDSIYKSLAFLTRLYIN